MSEQVRAAFDIEVKEGKAQEVVEAIFKARLEIINYIKDVVVRNNPDVDVSDLKLVALAGGCHIHEIDSGSGLCTMCGQYAESSVLVGF